MRAKLYVSTVKKYGEMLQFKDGKGNIAEKFVPSDQETVQFHAVAKTHGYDGIGLDEDNTFAKYSPSASLEITIANPALIGVYKPGDTFYVDFTPVPPPPAPSVPAK